MIVRKAFSAFAQVGALAIGPAAWACGCDGGSGGGYGHVASLTPEEILGRTPGVPQVRDGGQSGGGTVWADGPGHVPGGGAAPAVPAPWDGGTWLARPDHDLRSIGY
jgi:hypothetical protein